MRLLLVSLVIAGVIGTIEGAASVPSSAQTSQTQGAPGGGPGSQGAAATATGFLMGQVIDAASGKPVADALVSLSGAGARGAVAAGRGGQPSPRVLVDGQGRFLFRDLPAGSFTLSASKVGYFGGNSGQLSPTGPSRPVELGDDERIGGVTLRLWPYSSVSGTVLDEAGGPVAGMAVELLRRTAANGRWQLTGAGSANADDRGVFRFDTVTPGSYVVEAHTSEAQGEQLMMSLMTRDESTLMKMLPKLIERGEESLIFDTNAHMYPPTFYPSASSSMQATALTLSSGEERTGIDVRVKSVASHTIAGAVADVDASNRSLSIRLLPADTAAMGSDLDVQNTSMGQSGRFVFTGVPPGQYVIDVVSRQYPTQTFMNVGSRAASTTSPQPAPAAPAEPTLSATVPLTLSDRNITDLVIGLHQGARVSGRVVFDGGGERPAPESWPQITVTLVPADTTSGHGPIPPGRVETDGTFRTASVEPGRYLLRVGPVPGHGAGPTSTGRGPAAATWRPLSALIGNRDLLDQPIDLDASDADSIVLTFTDQGTASLSGTVRDASGAAASSAVLLLFPADSQLWTSLGNGPRRIKQARTTRTGSYFIPGLPAGNYFVAVGNDDLLTDWQAPGVLETLSRQATRVQLTDAQSRTLDLKSGGR